MQDAPLVGVVHGPRHGRDQPSRSAAVGGIGQEAACQAVAGDELHAEVVKSMVLTDFQNRHDVRVLERTHRLGLVAEPLALDAGGKPTGAVRFTDVFVWRDGRWRAVSAQETVIAS